MFYWILVFLIILFLIFSICAFVNFSENRKLLTLITALIFLFIAYQGVPLALYASAIKNKNVDYIKKAEKLAIFPKQKARFCFDMILFRESMTNSEVVETFDRAYSYLKSYKDSMFLLGAYHYLYANQTDKALKIAQENQDGSCHCAVYGYTGDYETALSKLKKCGRKFYMDYAVIYKNLGQDRLAQEYFNKAIENKDKELVRRYRNDYMDYKNYYKKQVVRYVEGFQNI